MLGAEDASRAVDRPATADPHVRRVVHEEQARIRHRPTVVAHVWREARVSGALMPSRIDRVVVWVRRTLKEGALRKVEGDVAPQPERPAPVHTRRKDHRASARQATGAVDRGLQRGRRQRSTVRVGAEVGDIKNVRQAVGGGIVFHRVRQKEERRELIDPHHQARRSGKIEAQDGAR